MLIFFSQMAYDGLLRYLQTIICSDDNVSKGFAKASQKENDRENLLYWFTQPELCSVLP